jgi:protein-S-isoprenylcysteine O-methyltransferase Ste14
MEKIYFIFMGICLLCYIIRTVFNILIYNKNPLAEKKIIVYSIYVVMGILWFSWFQLCFFDPIKMKIPVLIRYGGLLLFIIGVSLFVFSNIKLRGFEEKGELITSGIFSKIRNPMYFGFIIWIIGLPVFMRGLITLASSVIWIPFIIYWKILEEKELESKYKEYREYKKGTWF